MDYPSPPQSAPIRPTHSWTQPTLLGGTAPRKRRLGLSRRELSVYVDCTTQKVGGDAGLVRDKRKFNAPRRQVAEEKEQKVDEEGGSSLLASNGHIHNYSESPMSKSVGELPQSLAGGEADTEAYHREFGNDITNMQGQCQRRKLLPTGVLQSGRGYSNGHGDMPPGLENTVKALFQGESPTHCKPSPLGKERVEVLLQEGPAPAIEDHHLQEGINNPPFKPWSTKLPYGHRGMDHGQGGMGHAHENEAQPLFQFASGKLSQVPRAAKVRAEALIHGVAENSTNCHLVHEGSDKLKTHQGNSRPPSIAKQILDQILGKSPSPEWERVEIDPAQQTMVAPLFQFASGKHFWPSSAAKARAEALLLGEVCGDSSSGHLVEDESERTKTPWKPSMPTVGGQQPGQRVCPSLIGHVGMNSGIVESSSLGSHVGMNSGQVNSLRLPTCSGQQSEQSMNSPPHVKDIDDGQEPQPLFRFASGKHFNTSLAGRTRAEALLREAPDDCTSVHPVQERTGIPQSQQRSQRVPSVPGQRPGKEVCSPQSSRGALHGGEDNVAQPLFQFASGKHFKPSAAGKARAEALLSDGANEQGNHFQPIVAAGKENAVPQNNVGKSKLNFRPPLRTRGNIENIQNGHTCPNTGQGVPMEPPSSCPPGKESIERFEANAVQLDDPFLWNDAFLSDDVLLSDPGLLSCLEGVSSKPSSNPWRSRLSLNARKPKTGGSCILNVVMDKADLAQPLLEWKAVAASKARVDALRRSVPEHKIPYFVKNQ